jgi:hypothetical protein
MHWPSYWLALQPNVVMEKDGLTGFPGGARSEKSPGRRR